MPIGGFLNALGEAFGGYGQDVQTNLQRQRQGILDSQGLQMHAAQMRDFDAQAALRDQQTKQRTDQMQGNQRAFGTLSQLVGQTPDHPLAPVIQQGFDPSNDYQSLLKDQITQTQQAKVAGAAQARADAKAKEDEKRDTSRYATETKLRQMQIDAMRPKYVNAVDPKDPTATPRLMTEEAAAAAGLAIAPKGPAGAGAGQTRLPERLQQLGLALQAAGQAVPLQDQLVGSGGVGLISGVAGSELGQPGAKSQVANYLMAKTNPNYLKYKNAMAGAVMAAAHSVGGARINKEQTAGFGQQFAYGAGDDSDPSILPQKTQSFIGFLNAARATLPPAEVAKQEALIDPKQLAALRAKGYGNAPSAQDLAAVQQVLPKEIDVTSMMSQPSASPLATPTAAPGGLKLPVTPSLKPAKDYGIFGKPQE